MAFTAIYPNGLGESVADSIAVNTPFYTTGNVWYVHNATGTDAASPAGQNKSRPLATLEQAVTNAADGDTIVLMDGHEETCGDFPIDHRLLIVGGGQEDGIPTVRLSYAFDDDGMDITADGVELRNILFTAYSAASSNGKISIAASRFRGVGLYFEMGQYDDAEAVTIGTGETSIEFVGCTWISTATSASAQPASAVEVGGACTHVVFRDCVFDAGTVGFSGHWALDLNAATITDLRIENVSLLRGADVRLEASTTGYVAGVTSSGSAVINFGSGGG